MDPATAYETALAKRRELQSEARAMGINEEYISELVDRFYDRVRDNQEIGPVFNAVIGDNWLVHLQKMKGFWASIALRTETYAGKPVAAHRVITQIQPAHFEIWLRLFRETLDETSPSTEATEYFMKFANSIADRLKDVMLPQKEGAGKISLRLHS